MLVRDGMGKPDPSARNNRKYDMGKSQFSVFPTPNTVRQTGEGDPLKTLVLLCSVTGTALHPVLSSCPLNQHTKGSPGF